MNIVTEKDFVTMPWKNFGGITTEIFCLRNNITQEIQFRISEAKVTQSGKFSIFKGVERILMLTSGAGFSLIFKDQQIKVDRPMKPIVFAGEEEIHCELIGDTCFDFNVMTDRNYGSSTLTIKKIDHLGELASTKDRNYIYIPEIKTLHIIGIGEVFINNYGRDLLVYQIDLNLKCLST